MSWFSKQKRELSIIVREDGSLERQDIEYVDGEVVDPSEERAGMWDDVWSFFYAHGATVGGNSWEKKYKREYVDNGRVYNAESQNWEYKVDLGNDRRPTYLEQTIIPGYGDSRATG